MILAKLSFPGPFAFWFSRFQELPLLRYEFSSQSRRHQAAAASHIKVESYSYQLESVIFAVAAATVENCNKCAITI